MGYFRAEVINNLIVDFNQIILMNGIDIQEKRCLLPFDSDKNSPDFYKFTPKKFIHIEYDKSYRDRVTLSDIFINGKHLDISSIKHDPFKKEWIDTLWNHFNYFYRPPNSPRELLKVMNTTSNYLEYFQDCRKRLFQSNKKDL
jgi:hypothetical protein